MEKDYTLYGTKIYNNKTDEIGLLIYTWVNRFADGDVKFAACVDSKGRLYHIEMDKIIPVES
jgi:hypothetical protein